MPNIRKPTENVNLLYINNRPYKLAGGVAYQCDCEADKLRDFYTWVSHKKQYITVYQFILYRRTDIPNVKYNNIECDDLEIFLEYEGFIFV